MLRKLRDAALKRAGRWQLPAADFVSPSLLLLRNTDNKLSVLPASYSDGAGNQQQATVIHPLLATFDARTE